MLICRNLHTDTYMYMYIYIYMYTDMSTDT